VEFINISKDMRGDNLFQPFATTFEEGNRTICLGEAIVRAGRLRDGDNLGRAPRVVTERKASVKQANKAIQGCSKCLL